MKIWYQSLFDAGRIPAYFEGVRKRVATVARPGTEVHLHAMPEGVYGTRTPAEAVVYPRRPERVARCRAARCSLCS